MMEHIRQFDWCTSSQERYFVEECDLDNCVTEKIIRNKFYDPLISSESENEAPNNIDWDKVFKNKQNSEQPYRLYVPGLRPIPPFPKVSALTAQQHIQCLKVLCAENPQILPEEFLPRPTKQDHKVFEEVKEMYIKEQKEFIEWARTLWASEQCIRALRPKPAVESVYEAEFNLRAQRLRAFPKDYEMAAQIPLDTRGLECSMVPCEDLITTNAMEIPDVLLPDMKAKRFNIIRPCSVPEPCVKHPCRFILPNESLVSVLPLPEIHRELAQWCVEHAANIVSSEAALASLLQGSRQWAVPLSVCKVLNSDGEECNVVVLGSEFTINKETAPIRTYKAFRHMLESALIPSSERMRVLDRDKGASTQSTSNNNTTMTSAMSDDADSDDEDNLFIDAECDSQVAESDAERHENTANIHEENSVMQKSNKEGNKESTKEAAGADNDIGIYSCTCRDSLFEKPPPRSFKKWQVQDNNSNEKYDVIVHCSHKARHKSQDLVIEPIPEYQLDLGASQQPRDRVRSIALSLLLRQNASLLNVRVDGQTGDVVAYDLLSSEEFFKTHGDVIKEVANTIHTALNQLQGLLPGNYILQHEPSHGANALLFAAHARGHAQKLSLDFNAQLADSDEAKTVKIPPTLAPVLLPFHKFRKLLPCAFTAHAQQLVRAARRGPARQKQPPQAIKLEAERQDSGKTRKWPKRKQKKKKKNTD